MIGTQKWDKKLAADEQLIMEFGISPKYTRICMIGCIVLGLALIYPYGGGLIILAGGAFLFGYYEPAANGYALTTKRVLIRHGLVNKTTTSIEYNQITDISVNEPLFDRVVAHSGTLKINTAGSSTAEGILAHIDSPQDIKNKILELKGTPIEKPTT